MTVMKLGRLIPLCATLAILAACADAGDPLAPSRQVAAQAGEGEFVICKDANAAGSFDFNWTIAYRSDGSTYSTGSTTVAAGTCELAATVSTLSPLSFLVTVTEAPLAADWSLTGITAETSTPVPDVPVVDLGTQTVSNGRYGHDVGLLVTFTNAYTPPPPEFCTLTQGYWKNHAEDWDESGENYITTGDSFYNSGATALEILGMSAAGGNAYIQLAHQFIAASLNVHGLSGSGDADVDAALAGADAAFAAWPSGTAGPAKKSATRDQWLEWAGILDDFNNGVTGPGHCPE